MIQEQKLELYVQNGKETVKVRVEFEPEECDSREPELVERLKDIYLERLRYE